jgi:hypothetical protein
MGLLFSKTTKPENVKKFLNFGIEVTYSCDETTNIDKYDNKIRKIAKKYKINETASDWIIGTRGIQFEKAFQKINKKNILNFIKNIPDEYKVSILFISFTDTNNQYNVWHMIFYDKKINPDLSWLSKEDIKIYEEAYNRS